MRTSRSREFYGPPNKLAIPVRPSKHATPPFEGLNLTPMSGLKKRMRAMRRVGGHNFSRSQESLLAHAWYRKLITTAEEQNAALH